MRERAHFETANLRTYRRKRLLIDAPGTRA
jgi:hypothetical protein